jgi:hypothetical protein
MINIILISIFSAITFSCAVKTPDKIHQQSLRKPQSEYLEMYKGDVIKSFVAAGLPRPQITEHPGSWHLTITFGLLKPAQFEALKNTFSYKRMNPKYGPVYDVKRKYQLLDFLPPKVQALANTRLIRNSVIEVPAWFQKHKIAKGQRDILSNTNCWGTVHDVLMSDRFPETVFIFNIDSVVNYFKNPQYFSQFKSEENLKPYDVILYYDDEERTQMAHAAVSLGFGLIYEKEGLSEVDHYKINFLKFRSSNREYYSAIGNGPILTSQELFGLSNQPIDSELQAELVDPVKKAFYDHLVLVSDGADSGSSFLMSTASQLALTKNPKTGFYDFSRQTLPGSLFVPAIRKPIEY